MSAYTIKQSVTPDGAWGEIVATATDNGGGSIQRLAWQNIRALGGVTTEYIDAHDHGRELQCALVFDSQGEEYNPTEGGSEADGLMTNPSTSRLLLATVNGNVLETVTQMAYWHSYRGAKRSNVILKKRVTLGYKGYWNALEVVNTLYTPENESHVLDQFEFATGYMPPTFSVFETLNRSTGALAPVSDGPGEQPLPLVFSTPDKQWAMGVWAPDGTPGGGYGRWRFPGDCVKWNAVSRTDYPIVGATLTGRVICCVGSREDARQTLCSLTA